MSEILKSLFTDAAIEAAAKRHPEPDQARLVLSDLRAQLYGDLFNGTATEAFALAHFIEVLLENGKVTTPDSYTSVTLSLEDAGKFHPVSVVKALRALNGSGLRAAHDAMLALCDGKTVTVSALYDVDENTEALRGYGVAVVPAR